MKKTISIIMSVALIVCMIGGLTGCTTYNNFKNTFFSDNQVAAERTVKIGVYEPMSGQYKSQGKEEIIGIELAKELYPTVCGKQVELVYADNQSSMYTGETAIQELVAQSPSVILGSYGETLSLVASDYVMAASIPAITISSTNPLITANNDYYFSATFTETRQGDALADFAYNSLNKDVVATVRPESDDTATATIKRFTNSIKKLTDTNKSVAGNFIIPSGQTDYTEIIENIRNSGAKAVFLALSPSAAKTFLSQAIDHKLTHVLFLGTKEWNDESFIAFVKENPKLQVAYSTDFSQDIKGQMPETFLNAYRAKYGEDAEPAVNTAVAFDAYLLALKAIETAYEEVLSTTPEEIIENAASEAEGRADREAWQIAYETGIPGGKAIKNALNSINDFEGASGSISYNGKNEATKTIVVNYIAEGDSKPTYVVD